MKKSKYKIAVLVCIVLLLLTVIISLMVGSYQMTPGEVIGTFLGNGDSMQRFTIYELRLPRVVLAVIVASALGVSGGVLQAVTRNPLSEPGMIGINAGAALFVVVWISAGTSAYYSELAASKTFFMPVLAIVGSLLTVAVIYLFSYKRGIRPVRFILTGVGVNAGITAVISFYQLNMSKGDYNQVLTWTNGSLWGSSWNYIIITLPLILVLIFFILFRSKVLDVLALGDELAMGVGVSLQREVLFFLILSSCLAAIATSVAGNIAFLGLLGPQIAKRLAGPSHRKMLPLSAGVSAVILVTADTVARNLFSPIEIPVGIIVSIVGVPYFIYIMLKGK
ncbi:FecCD family ABC transporter permease [Sellimonas sp.]|uniref:FecCD family ABC transporter permease n=1 Tax=Sellimonas sp. TaxID=2021466 RepID=UPI00257E4B11|nr:iron ABC transporter permease [Sellimonas sp.]